MNSKLTRQTLTPKQNHALTNLILEEFSVSGKSLEDFAKYAGEKLGHPVTKIHIATRIEAFDIPANRAVPKPRANGADTGMLLAHEQRITSLEERLAVIQAWINTTFPTYGGKAIK